MNFLLDHVNIEQRRMNTCLPRFASFVIVLFLTACHNSAPDPSTLQTPRQMVNADNPPQERVSSDTAQDVTSISFHVELAGRLDCGNADATTSATVNWDTSALGIQGVDVYVRSTEEEGEVTKLWISGPAKGSEGTPEWVRPGTVFELRLHDEAKLLAHSSVNCS